MYTLKVDHDAVDQLVRDSLIQSLDIHQKLDEVDEDDKLSLALNIVIAYYSLVGEYKEGKYDDYF